MRPGSNYPADDRFIPSDWVKGSRITRLATRSCQSEESLTWLVWLVWETPEKTISTVPVKRKVLSGLLKRLMRRTAGQINFWACLNKPAEMTVWFHSYSVHNYCKYKMVTWKRPDCYGTVKETQTQSANKRFFINKVSKAIEQSNNKTLRK